MEIPQRKEDEQHGIVQNTACYGDKDTKLLMDRAELSRRVRRDTESRARWRVMQRGKKRCLKTETVSHWREDSHKRSKTF